MLDDPEGSVRRSPLGQSSRIGLCWRWPNAAGQRERAANPEATQLPGPPAFAYLCKRFSNLVRRPISARPSRISAPSLAALTSESSNEGPNIIDMPSCGNFGNFGTRLLASVNPDGDYTYPTTRNWQDLSQSLLARPSVDAWQLALDLGSMKLVSEKNSVDAIRTRAVGALAQRSADEGFAKGVSAQACLARSNATRGTRSRSLLRHVPLGTRPPRASLSVADFR